MVPASADRFDFAVERTRRANHLFVEHIDGIYHAIAIAALGSSVWTRAIFVSPRTGVEKFANSLRDYVHPIIGDKRPSDIGNQDAEEILRQPVELKGRNEAAFAERET